MAQYDDWVYERGLENEDWVHDRWGDDDWDDDYDGYQDKGEDEDMEQIGNRISFDCIFGATTTTRVYWHRCL